FGILVSEWNSEVTERLYEGAYQCLIEHGAKPGRIVVHTVPGSFELSLAARWLADGNANGYPIDAVICLGCIIQGETPHFDFVAQATAEGIMRVNLRTQKPIVFGVLTTYNLKQALDRAGGKHGNKGIEAAITAIKMLGLREQIYKVKL
ncbi:MAG: 6,7-dimethyl-8-ribityllumazine synthase, partial [Microscillaceae bacterium]|nr:6,7-dimethyl-8-ribityllumazine synthase [Microscillaceae bacterium]MDW8461077.1 6,7-dimethyl-8-ribityllumazine synthase [Cytophagales bacterium]